MTSPDTAIPGERAEWLVAWTQARALYPADEHGMPLPTWSVRGFSDDGAEAWNQLVRRVPGRQGAFSVYAHLPFCKTRCPFCDCHATAMPRGDRTKVEKYLLRFLREIEQWHALGTLAHRPVTTIHLGGGTPHALLPDEFEQVVQALAANFAADKGTEWAIETNCRCLDEEHVGQLARLGFTRIHVGAQTLRPRLRTLLGRRDAPETALARIRACVDRGWIVSVDMLYGLPEQTADHLREDLRLLATAGVHGVSLYRLNHGKYNQRFMQRHGLAARGPERLFADYRMFMEAAGFLASLGYSKNHFTHFAREQDRNLYARHAVRGEDLLALGTTADGVFGGYYYRHGELADYLAGSAARPPLEGGGAFTLAERRARELITQLMSGEVRDGILDANSHPFVQNLAAAGLLRRDASARSWLLTDAGSWFIGECTAGALRLYQKSGPTAGEGPRA